MDPESGKLTQRGSHQMANGDSRAAWDMIFKVSQVAVLPLLAAMFYMLMQMSSLDRRLAIIEVTTRNPQIDIGLIQKIAIIEERQNKNVAKVDAIEQDFQHHREVSTYDPAGATRRIPRER